MVEKLAKSEDTLEDGSVYASAYAPNLTGFESFDLGMVLSVGYKLPFGKDLLSVQLIDNIGLTNINEGRPYGQSEKNHTIQLLLGYSFLRNK